MTTFDAAVAGRMDELASRVARLEEFRVRAEGALVLRGILRSSEEPTMPARLVEARVPEVEAVTPPVVPQPVPPLAPPIEVVRPEGARPEALQRTVRVEAPKQRAPKELDAFSIERLIGGRWLAAAGALIVVIGVGLFLKLAYDLGWLGGLGAAAKCSLGAGFGALLLGAGEVVRRRVNALGSVGLFGAGLGAMYASAFAAHAQYGLVGVNGVMVLLVGCVVLGIGIGALTNLAGVAVLSLLGGYLTPLLLQHSSAAAWFMPAYLFALLMVGLALSGWKNVRFEWFGSLRTVAWWGTLLLGGAWVSDRGADEWMIALVFLSAVWGATHLERFFSAGRKDRAGARAVVTGASFSDARLLAGSLSTTAWCALLAIWVLDETNAAPTWYVTAGLAAVAFVLAARFVGRRRVFTEVPRTKVERLGAGMAIQSGGLVIATLALALSGWVQIGAGLALGVAAVVAGRWVRSRALDYYGMAVLGFASATLFGQIAGEWSGFMSHDPATMLAGLAATDWSWRIVLTAGAWLVYGALMLIRNETRVPARAIISAGAGVIGLMLAFANGRSEAASLCVYWGALGLALTMAPGVSRRLHLAPMGLVVLAVAIAAWVYAFPMQGWNESVAPLALHTGLLVALGLAAAWVMAARRVSGEMREREPRELMRFVGWAASGLLVFAGTSFEVARGASVLAHDSAAQRSAVSIYWGMFSIVLLLIGLRWKSAVTRYAGLALINIAALKVVIVDLADAPPAWRIASFIGLGLLMIGTAVGYAKLAARAGRTSGDVGADSEAGGSAE